MVVGDPNYHNLVLITKTTRMNLENGLKVVWFALYGTYRSMPDCSDRQNCYTFSDYLQENYAIFDSKFTPNKWAGITSEEKRTNNGIESFHAHFDEQFYASHPAILIFNELYLAKL